MNCDISFKIDLEECCETLWVMAGLTASTSYMWLITDKNGLEYYERVTTDIYGNFFIDCSLFPLGSLNRASGEWLLEVFPYVSAYYTLGTVADLTFCGEVYQSVLFNFVSRTDSGAVQYISCV